MNILTAVLALLLTASSCSNTKEPVDQPTDKPTQSEAPSFYKGVTMTFASYLEDVGNKTYKENGVAKDPYQSVKDHGGNVVRLPLEPETFSRTNGMNSIGAPNIDWEVMPRLKKNMLRAKAAGLDVILTLKHENTIPSCWYSITDKEALGQKLYEWCYNSLDELYAQGTIPSIVTIGNEIDAWFMVPPEYQIKGKEQFDYPGNVFFVNKGIEAVKKFNSDKDTNIRTACHLSSPQHIKWWFSEHYDKGLQDFDIMAVSWYPGWHSMGTWKSWAEAVSWLKSKGKDLLVLETSYPYTLVNADNQGNAYNADLSSEDQTSPAIQRATLGKLAAELKEAGAIGMVTWGNESLPTDIYIYANDEWGRGSTWENNSYWDASGNLHEGINWMKDI